MELESSLANQLSKTKQTGNSKIPSRMELWLPEIRTRLQEIRTRLPGIRTKLWLLEIRTRDNKRSQLNLQWTPKIPLHPSHNKRWKRQYLTCLPQFKILAVFHSSKTKFQMMLSWKAFRSGLSFRSWVSHHAHTPTISPKCATIQRQPRLPMPVELFWALDLRKSKVQGQHPAPMEPELR